MICPNCGLPMSFADDAELPAPEWYCDGPNGDTTEQGCGYTVEVA